MPAKIIQLSPRVLANRRNGAKGGAARAAKHTPEVRKAWSSKGGKSTLATYGSDIFSHANSLRRRVGRYRTPAELTKLAKKRKAVAV